MNKASASDRKSLSHNGGIYTPPSSERSLPDPAVLGARKEDPMPNKHANRDRRGPGKLPERKTYPWIGRAPKQSPQQEPVLQQPVQPAQSVEAVQVQAVQEEHSETPYGKPSKDVVPNPEFENSEGKDFAAWDGITHINIYAHGQTDLGRGLSHFSFSPFKHPFYGPFNCMEGFWYFIKAEEPDDALRSLVGHKAKMHGKTLKTRSRYDFYEIIIAANFYKIEQNPALKQMMIESRLPFDHYYLYGPGNLLIRPAGFEWLVEGFENIREMLREGRRPAPIVYT